MLNKVNWPFISPGSFARAPFHNRSPYGTSSRFDPGCNRFGPAEAVKRYPSNHSANHTDEDSGAEEGEVTRLRCSIVLPIDLDSWIFRANWNVEDRVATHAGGADGSCRRVDWCQVAREEDPNVRTHLLDART